MDLTGEETIQFQLFGKIDTDNTMNVYQDDNASYKASQIANNSEQRLQPHHIHIGDECDALTCQSLDRIKHTLHKYNQIENDDTKISIVDIYCQDYNNTKLLNDFHHLLSTHTEQFDELYHTLNPTDEFCAMEKCLLLRRNYRNRSSFDKSLYLGHEQQEIINQQLLDRIHCYFLHSFDIGHKLTTAERQRLLHEHKYNQDDNILCEDLVVKQISKLINTKRQTLANASDLQALELLNKSNKKFVSQHMGSSNIVDSPDSKSQSVIQYSYGYRFYYWNFYKKHQGNQDPFDTVSDRVEGNLKDWYVKTKYKDLKCEVTDNEICRLTISQWNNLNATAKVHLNTDLVREMWCPRFEDVDPYGESAENLAPYNALFSTVLGLRFAGINNKDLMSLDHIISIMVYCNNDELQRKFSETFRKLNIQETNQQMKKRHAHYHWLARRLRECVEYFGMKIDTTKTKDFTVYHGISERCTFPSLHAFINGPTSTTFDYCVATNFCNNKGLILDMNITTEWQYRQYNVMAFPAGWHYGNSSSVRLFCFDCQPFSDFPSEQEVFFIGGARRFRFNTIIDASLGINYQMWINAMKQCTYNMSNGHQINEDDVEEKAQWFKEQATNVLTAAKKNILTASKYSGFQPVLPKIGNEYTSENNKAKSRDEMQAVFRLLSHELHQNDPDHPKAHKLESCPEIIDKLLHNHCQSMRRMVFYGDSKLNCKVQDGLFRDQNGWINLELILKIFPNLQCILYVGKDEELSFVTIKYIYNSIISVFKDQGTKLQTISLDLESSDYNEFNEDAKFHKKQLRKAGLKVTNVNLQDSVGIVYDKETPSKRRIKFLRDFDPPLFGKWHICSLICCILYPIVWSIFLSFWTWEHRIFGSIVAIVTSVALCCTWTAYVLVTVVGIHLMERFTNNFFNRD